MSSQSDFFRPTLHANKKIIYNDTSYSIDFGILKRCSTYFTKNRQKYKHCEEIHFSKDNFNVSDESFENFISFCQMRPYQINNSNVFDLYLLSYQFGVEELLQETQEHISKNHHDLIFQSISFKKEMMNRKNDEIIKKLNLQEEEEIIATHFFEYIDDKRLLDLPVQFLYNVINKFDINKLDQKNQTKMIDFLFLCLDHYGKEASILFLNLDIENQRIDILTRLQSKYMKKIDFFMLNPKFLVKSINDLLSEMNLLKNEYTNITKEHETQCKQDEQKSKELAETHEAEITKIEQKYQKIFIEKEEKIKNLEEKYQELVQNHNEQIQEIKQTANDEMKNLKQFFEGILNKQNQIIEEQKNAIQSIQQEIHILHKIESFDYQEGKEFEGIMKSLCNKTGGNIHNNGTIEITTNSEYSADYKPQNVVDYNTDNYYCPDNVENIHVLFDFKDKFIRLSKYSIMSGFDWYNAFLKNWVIEVSNDGSNWMEIDKQENESSLKGPRKFNTFTIKQKITDFYRYIRLRQTGKSWYENSSGYYIEVFRIEFFVLVKE